MKKEKQAKIDENTGLRMQVYNKGQYEPMEASDIGNIIQLGLTVINETGGRPYVYDNSEQGLTAFVERSKGYIQYVFDSNKGEDERKYLLDIETWCVYLGICRMTLMNYEKRGGSWASFIQYFKGLIFATKKALAMNFKTPPVTFIFDAVNNHNYHNVSEFHIQPAGEEDTDADIAGELAKYNLIWDEEKGEYISGE